MGNHYISLMRTDPPFQTGKEENIFGSISVVDPVMLMIPDMDPEKLFPDPTSPKEF